MRFQDISGCRRRAPEQRFIQASLGVFAQLPEERRQEIRELIGEIARTPGEGRALFTLLIRNVAPQTLSETTGVPVRRLYRMRREFYDRIPIR